MKIYETYNKVKDVFKRPRIRFWCGLYKKCPHFNIYQTKWIRIGKRGTYYWCRNGRYVWDLDYMHKHPIFTRLFKPIYCIPNWLNISFKSTDAVYKHKFQYTYLEYPPHVILYLFGFLFLWVLDAPNGNTDDYWESIETYLEDPDIQSVDDKMGTAVRVKEGASSRRHRLSCDFLNEYSATYIALKRWRDQTVRQ